MSAAARRQFQAKLFADLKQKSFDELSTMPEESSIKAPAALKDWKFTILRTQLSREKIEMTLQARFDSSDGDASLYNYSFRISSNGRIQEDRFVAPED
jgi:hypothetical protein